VSGLNIIPRFLILALTKAKLVQWAERGSRCQQLRALRSYQNTWRLNIAAVKWGFSGRGEVEATPTEGRGSFAGLERVILHVNGGRSNLGAPRERGRCNGSGFEEGLFVMTMT
jgi:hypothetical protein